jgi:regulator of replication initiation timing
MDNTLKQLLEEVYRLTMENEQLRQQVREIVANTVEKAGLDHA